MTYICHHAFSVGCAVPPAGHWPLLLRCHPPSHVLLPSIPPRSAVGRVIVGTSNTFSREKAASYPRATAKATSANPAETGDRIRNEQLESETWWRSNWPGGAVQEDMEAFAAGTGTARRGCVYVLKKRSNVPLWELNNTPLSGLLWPKEADKMLGPTWSRKENDTR